MTFLTLEKNLFANFQIYYNFCPLTPPKTTPELAMPLILMLEYIIVGINDIAYVGFYCILQASFNKFDNTNHNL